MASAINDNFPAHGNPTTQSVRDNFGIAKNEITALQNALAGLQLNMPYLPLAGASMTGPMMLFRDPEQAMEPVTKQYFDTLLSAIETRLNNLEARIGALEHPTP